MLPVQKAETPVAAPAAPLLALQAPPQLPALTAPPALAALPAPQQAAQTAMSQAVASRQGSAAEPMLAIAASPWPGAGSGVAGSGAVGAAQLPEIRPEGSRSVFVPTYEWTTVGETVSVPPGLEVRLPVDGSNTRSARIPPNWRLLVVSDPGNDACRIDVTRITTLVEVRTAIAGAMAAGDVERVQALLADGVSIAGTDARSWTKTVEQASLFGRRITTRIKRSLVEIWTAEMQEIEAAISNVEKGVAASKLTAGDAHSTLAQLEARLDGLQCKAIDSAGPAGNENERMQRRELTRRAELLNARLGGLFVGLGVAKEQGQRVGNALWPNRLGQA